MLAFVFQSYVVREVVELATAVSDKQTLQAKDDMLKFGMKYKSESTRLN